MLMASSSQRATSSLSWMPTCHTMYVAYLQTIIRQMPAPSVISSPLSHAEGLQPKYIPQLVAKQLEGDYDVVTGTRYAQQGGVAGWDARRKLTSRGANFCAATLLNPGVIPGLSCSQV